MKVKEHKDKTKLRLNDGNLNIAIDRNGNVLEFGESGDTYKVAWYQVLTAKELDKIAEKSRLLNSLTELIQEVKEKVNDLDIRDQTAETHHDISFNDDLCYVGDDINGTVTFGCQEISPEDVARVHAISRKARGLKPVK